MCSSVRKFCTECLGMRHQVAWPSELMVLLEVLNTSAFRLATISGGCCLTEFKWCVSALGSHRRKPLCVQSPNEFAEFSVGIFWNSS